MRWSARRLPKPPFDQNALVGRKRVRSWFALFPTHVGDEWRWLEYVSVEWECQWVQRKDIPRSHILWWVRTRFVNE